MDAFSKKHNIHITAYSPLGNNLVGKPKLTDYPEVIEIAKKLDATPAQVLVAYGVYRGYSVIPKSVQKGTSRELRPRKASGLNGGPRQSASSRTLSRSRCRRRTTRSSSPSGRTTTCGSTSRTPTPRNGTSTFGTSRRSKLLPTSRRSCRLPVICWWALCKLQVNVEVRIQCIPRLQTITMYIVAPLCHNKPRLLGPAQTRTPQLVLSGTRRRIPCRTSPRPGYLTVSNYSPTSTPALHVLHSIHVVGCHNHDCVWYIFVAPSNVSMLFSDFSCF